MSAEFYNRKEASDRLLRLILGKEFVMPRGRREFELIMSTCDCLEGKVPKPRWLRKKETMDALNDLRNWMMIFENESEDESVQLENNKQTMDCFGREIYTENESEMEIDE
ncbi:hypothetical protein HAX54_004812, partial [Datura stramonium]|nr:hypothetical protein [Datura stramonium]